MTAIESITSAANPRVKQAAALRDADARRATGLTLVDGRRELFRAAAAGVEIVEVFVAADALTHAADPPLADWLSGLAARRARGSRPSHRGPSSGSRSAVATRGASASSASGSGRWPTCRSPPTGRCS